MMFFESFLGGGSEGVDDLCFHIWGNFFSSSSFSSSAPPSPKPPGPYLSLEAQIPVLRPKSLKA